MTGARTRHVPLRRCAVCRSSLPQSQLIRFARDGAGDWQLDRERRAGGRGIWVCTEARCQERKTLGRAFRAQAAEVAAQLATLSAKSQEQSQARTSQNGGIDV
ncbi:MAG: DUF448 domain-containing protein [Trueperaceae bacterium]